MYKKQFSIITIIILLLLCCNNRCYKFTDKAIDNTCIDSIAIIFNPSSINFDESINNEFDDCIFSIKETKNNVVIKSIYLILLKQYHYQLKLTKQDFDLITFKNTSAHKIVDMYIKINNLDSAMIYQGSLHGQGLFAHQVYKNLLEKQDFLLNYPEINQIIKQIDIEMLNIR
jgi:hypothetical protein